MKKKYLALALTAFLCSHSYAQDSNAKEIDDKYVENDVVADYIINCSRMLVRLRDLLSTCGRKWNVKRLPRRHAT